MNRTAKVVSLFRSGAEFRERIRNKIGVWIDRSHPSGLTELWNHADAGIALLHLGLSPGNGVTDGLESLEEHVLLRRSELAPSAPFGTFHDGTETLGRLCYAACRALRPRVVVETGVAYGLTSAYMLQALAENGAGALHSIDLPPLGPEAMNYVGYFVPNELRGRWNLHIGAARKLLPEVVQKVGGVDIFIHDSLHTYAHMKLEFATALTALRPGGILIADDVEGNRAFEEATRDSRVTSWFAIREKEKDAICGAMRIGGL